MSPPPVKATARVYDASADGWINLPIVVRCDCCKGRGATFQEFTGCDRQDPDTCACATHTDWTECGYCDGEGGAPAGRFLNKWQRWSFARDLNAALGFPAPEQGGPGPFLVDDFQF